MDHIDLRHLRYFVAVAEELHFGRAAARLGIQQPPLSQQIKYLESTLGHPLFERTSRSVALTAAGRELLERARRTLARVQEDLNAVRRVGRGEIGNLTVGFAGSAMLTSLPDVIRSYRREYPAVQLRLMEMVTAEVIEHLRDGTVDLGFLRDPGEVEGLVIQSLMREPFVAILPARHRLASQQSISIAKLKGEPFVFHPRSMGPVAYDRTMGVCERAGFRPQVVQEAPQWPTAIRLIGAGLGVSIAPACVAKLGTPGVVFRRIVAKDAFTEIALGRRDEPMTPTAEAFVGMAKVAFAAN
ncbi:MAG TPA: LysR substrate-binding domain-containing protein [Terriglobales bacterium]|nr:LysR substrate-binding domain-containing protein [Terriglobales bacterium]